MGKTRVAIIGGGPSGMSTAYHLSSTDELREAYEVTVYQLGWRLGGKGATGRDQDKNWRIEEHGIHGFCGFYWNSLGMMKDCYETMHPEWSKGSGDKLPLTMDEAFLGSSWAAHPEQVDGNWQEEGQWLLSRGDPLWHRDADDWRRVLTPQNAIKGIVKEMIRRGRRPDTDHDDKDLHTGHLLHNRRMGLFHGFLEEALGIVEDLAGKALIPLLREALEKAEDVIEDLQEARIEHAHLHNALTTIDFLAALVRGLLQEDGHGNPLLFREFDDIDGIDYREWLLANGASQHTVDSAVVAPPAMILFPAPDGDTFSPPTLSAAVYAAWVVRNFCVAGDTFYFFAAGTGETVIRPAYETLKSRGVKFEFFHKLEEVELGDSDGGRSVESLTFTVQAKTKGGAEYDPLLHVFGKADSFRVWPNHPLYEQLEHGASLYDIDLESWWAPTPPHASTRVLTRGAVEEGFDVVVWAAPPPTMRYSGAALIDSETGTETLIRASTMASTPTMEYQIWTTVPTTGTDARTPDDRATSFGWPVLNEDGSTFHRYAAATFPNPLDGVVDFTDLMKYEIWPAQGGAKGLVYFCGQFEDVDIVADPELSDPQTPRRALERGWGEVLQTHRRMGDVVPATRVPERDRTDPALSDAELLWAPDGMTGMERVRYQYVKVNIDPPERYMQGPPGTASKRMFPWETGVANLAVAGDWVYTGFNSGCFEGAVIGGALAAFAVSGVGKPSTIPGFEFCHPESTKDADRVQPIVALPDALARTRAAAVEQ